MDRRYVNLILILVLIAGIICPEKKAIKD